MRNVLEDACKRAGIARVTPNDLRRTLASWLKQAGVDSFAVAQIPGHTTSRMVELVYGRIDQRTLATAMARLPILGLHRAIRTVQLVCKTGVRRGLWCPNWPNRALRK